MVLTDRQRSELHAGIYEYLLSRDGEMFERAAEALLEADPNCNSRTNGSNRSITSSPTIPDDDASVGSRMSISSRMSTSSRFSVSSMTSIRSLNAPILEKKWTAVPRLQKKVLELERAMASNAKIYAHRSGLPGGAAGAMVASGAVERRMLPRPPCAHTLKGHSAGVTCVELHPVFTIAVSGSEDATIKVWDHESGEYVRTLKGHTNHINSLAFTPTGSHLASSSSDLSIKLWDFSTYTCVRTLRGHDHTISAITFIPSPPSFFDEKVPDSNGTTTPGENGTSASSAITTTTAGSQFLVSGSRDNTVKFWDLETGFCEHTISDHSDWVRCLAVRSSDGGLMASAGSDPNILVYSIDNSDGPKKIGSLSGHEHVVECLAFTTAPTPAALSESGKNTSTVRRKEDVDRDGNKFADYLVSGGRDRSIRLWNISTFQCISVFKHHENWVRGVVIHPSSKYIISTSDDKTIRVLDVKSKRCLRTIAEAHPHFISSIAMHHTLPILVSGGVDQSVKCWALD